MDMVQIIIRMIFTRYTNTPYRIRLEHMYFQPHSANSGYSASPFPSRPSLPNHALSTSFYHNSFMTPIRNGRMRSPDQDLGDWSREKINDTQHVLQTKVYIPEPPVSIDGKKVLVL